MFFGGAGAKFVKYWDDQIKEDDLGETSNLQERGEKFINSRHAAERIHTYFHFYDKHLTYLQFAHCEVISVTASCSLSLSRHIFGQ
jgi:hypothetical protein